MALSGTCPGHVVKDHSTPPPVADATTPDMSVTRAHTEPEKPLEKAPENSPAKQPEKKVIDAMFEAFAQGEEKIGPDGAEELCRQLEIEPDNVLALVLAWKFGAKENGYFTRDEFVNGMKSLGCSSISQLRKQLDSINVSLNSNLADMHQLYQFAFEYCKLQPEQKLIENTIAATMINLALDKRPGFKHVERWCAFLSAEGVPSVKAVNKDQWDCFFDFSRQVPDDLANWHSDDPWPCLFDEFVKFCNTH
eukprot:TRINITY_DN903_c0_g1_i5.p1 TRINITY_DN903_c0_g1~~TRINITY_DN903_c0_g1_i5.p1  ORF type:complete len:250 (-),score=59.46 TRINITY_DN903_c0_g1_i5:106-855(-)